MRRFVLIALACVSCLALVSLPFEASAQPDPFEESRPAIQVIPLSHAAVAEVRGLLGDVAEIQGVEVSIDPRTNCIILIGDADGIEIIQALCQVIDTAPRMIDTEITMYELRGEAAQQSEFTPESLESPDNIRVIRRIRLQSLENQMTEIQLGEMVPVKTGEVFGGGRGGPPGAQTQAIYQMEDLGTIVAYTTRVSGDSITMELTVETSRLRNADESEDESNLSSKTIGQLQSTISLTPGEPTVIGDFTSLDAPADTRFVVVVTADLK